MSESDFNKLRAMIVAQCLSGFNACTTQLENEVELALDQADSILACCNLENAEAVAARG